MGLNNPAIMLKIVVLPQPLGPMIEATVHYAGIGETVKLYFCRFPYQKDWKLYLSTDESLSVMEMLQVYSVRWTIEVFFKEAKQQLQLGRHLPSRSTCLIWKSHRYCHIHDHGPKMVSSGNMKLRNGS
ncbi:hypothetical protein UB32_16690 [Mesobacillus subterraneus]|uniref:Transposase IS4-like domain-containing protein n=1 Tax=Mesobacillus subterraneus TaxID=285983 RepID=A0A0D6Z799_9BACI|nr:hypothetical protein UB32_16690 [Mesobacillus subterraneus]